MKKTKILFVIEALQTNGASKSLLSLLKSICEEYTVSLFLFSHDGAMVFEIPQSVKILPEFTEYRILCQQMKYVFRESLRNRKFRLAWFRFQVFFERAMKKPFSQWQKLPEIKGDWDIVCGYADGFVSSVVINKVIGGKKTLWIHENYEDNPKPREILDAFHKADAIVGVSNDAIQHLKNIIGTDVSQKACVVHNIVDPDAVQKASEQETVKLPGLEKNIVSVGRISYEKGYDMIPEIMDGLLKTGIDVHWSIIGSGLDKIKASIINDAKSRSVECHIHFLGEKSNPHPYTKASDCFVQLSRHEGWCMTLTEALALKKPVVVSDLPVFHEQVFEGVNGYFAHDTKSFVRAISLVLGDITVKMCNLDKFPCSPESVKHEFSSMIQTVCKDTL